MPDRTPQPTATPKQPIISCGDALTAYPIQYEAAKHSPCAASSPQAAPSAQINAACSTNNQNTSVCLAPIAR